MKTATANSEFLQRDRQRTRVGRTDGWCRPDWRGDAFNMAKRQDDCSNGKEETTANNTPGRTQAGPDELGKDVLPVER